jgi:signal transduction histidine kinase
MEPRADAIETARRAAHELNNQLTLVIGYGELLEDMVDGEAAELVRLLIGGARHGVENLRRVQTQLHTLGALPNVQEERGVKPGPVAY